MLQSYGYSAKCNETTDAPSAPIPAALSSLTGYLLELDAVASCLVRRLDRVLVPTGKPDQSCTEPSCSIPFVEDLHQCEVRVRSVISALRDAEERLAL